MPPGVEAQRTVLGVMLVLGLFAVLIFVPGLLIAWGFGKVIEYRRKVS
jgi:hypothetical protein